jgi:hypothetical protein
LRTLSDHIFDLAQNSVNAEARNIHITVEEDVSNNVFSMIIEDDGFGIPPQNVDRTKDTFFTTRPSTMRNVGMGLSLMDAACQRSGGQLTVDSRYRHGTVVTATMEHDNIDRTPLGDVADLFTSLMMSTIENKVIWTLEHVVDGRGYILKNRRTMDEMNILSYGEAGVRDLLYEHIAAKEKGIH